MASNRGSGPVPTAPIPQLQSSRPVFSNPWLDLREDVLLWPGASRRAYGIVTVKPGVTVLALDEPTDMVWCVWQYRPAIGRVSLELVGGGIEDGESPLDAAQRELAEEVGVAAGRWDSLGELHTGATAIVDSQAHVFLARDLKAVARGGDDVHEIAAQALPRDEVFRRATQGEITHAASVCALLKARLLLEGESL
ncbi:MAG: NUDIX hydrolase [Chloroflexi bacterium]|nr:NUDIX hydrolase [Chloroflexota bacterium]